ncbi:MAG TPA: serine protease [Blastocatellia bacterium]|nr:serine protease [Blastocatellia bacterium]
MNELLAIVTLIVQIQSGQVVGTATGFFYLKNETIYFVTNRHVVLDNSKGVKPDILRLKLHTDPKDQTKNADVDVPLYENGKAKWFDHKDFVSKGIDIVVVELDQNKFKNGFAIKALSEKNFVPQDLLVSTGEDVIVIGFPRGLSDATHNLPLVRNAMIASSYGVNFSGRPLFIVDANLQPGMSGSPVMVKPKDVWADKQGGIRFTTGSPTYFLGVFSATLGVNLPNGQQEQLGLGAVWYGYLIEEIIATIKKIP